MAGFDVSILTFRSSFFFMGAEKRSAVSGAVWRRRRRVTSESWENLWYTSENTAGDIGRWVCWKAPGLTRWSKPTDLLSICFPVRRRCKQMRRRRSYFSWFRFSRWFVDIKSGRPDSPKLKFIFFYLIISRAGYLSLSQAFLKPSHLELK